jgi:hypothetical protein
MLSEMLARGQDLYKEMHEAYEVYEGPEAHDIISHHFTRLLGMLSMILCMTDRVKSDKVFNAKLKQIREKHAKLKEEWEKAKVELEKVRA